MTDSWMFDNLFFAQNDSDVVDSCSVGNTWLNDNDTYAKFEECRDVNNVATHCRCEFATDFGECIPVMGYVSYTKHMYCLYGPEGVPSVVAMSVAWLLVLFAGLGVTANDFLCPSLFIISKTLKMSQNVAGVTLLAFGNGSPDIFSAMAGIKAGKNEMVIGGLIGGGIFVTTVVAGSIFLTQDFGMMKRPFLRDVIFYMTAAGAAFYLFFSREINIYHSIAFVLLYVVYIIVVVASRYIHQRHLQLSDKAADLNGKFISLSMSFGRASCLSLGLRFSIKTYNSNFSCNGTEAADAEKGMKIKGTKAADYDNPEAYGVVLTAFFKYSWDEDRRRNSRHHYCYDNEVFAISLHNIESPPPSYEETELKTIPKSEDCSPGCDYYTTSKEDEKVRPPEPVNQWRDFLEKLCPVNIREWSKQTWMERALDILKVHNPWLISQLLQAKEQSAPLTTTGCILSFRLRKGAYNALETIAVTYLTYAWFLQGSIAPVLFVILITTPVVDYKCPRDNWCRILNSLHLITGPLFITVVMGYGTSMIGDVFPALALVGIISGVLAGITYCLTTPDNTPRFHTAFAYIGFGVSVMWIYCIANEIVVLLQAVGIAFNLSDSILGLTILAWGNCLLDFLSNLAVARKGFPRMGIAACFGAPFLTLLLGVGIPCIIKLAQSGGLMELNYTPLTTILFSALAVSLVSTVTIMIVCRFQTKRAYGIYLICLYLAFLVIAVLKESNIF